MIYKKIPNLILGFHGCDSKVKEEILNGKAILKRSENAYDWLGHGIYFWENDEERALEYAKFIHKHPQKGRGKIETPDVIGAVIDLGLCLNLVDSHFLELLKGGYELVVESFKNSGLPLPQNRPIEHEKDLLIRELDCAVIEAVHSFNIENSKPRFDSVRGVFWEGNELYPNAGFKEKNHIQICIRNPNCIKGYFRPLKNDEDFEIP